MTDVDKVLEERGKRYGSFEEHARITQQFMEVAETSPSYSKLSYVHKEALHMNLHKVARMLCGDPWYDDNVVDIIGYNKLLLDYIKKHNDKQIFT